MSETIKQYDVVRIVAILDASVIGKAHPYQRPPRIGDRAAVLEIYSHPPGNELECCGTDGHTIWLGGFSPDDLVLEVVWSFPAS
jgi:hypothetical protein